MEDVAGKPHVLVAEDSLDLARLFEAILSPHARVSLWERDFLQLLQPEAWEGVDAALLDHMLGGEVTGLSIATFLKATCPEVRVVILTAASVGRPQELDAVADRVLIKPEPAEVILAALELV